jgi:catechol 2,3-dioxygenase-like lactoylglutathione lyase family enzyme
MLSAGLHEIVLVVKNVSRSVQFYQDVMGLVLKSEPSNEWARFATISKENPQWLGITSGDLLYEENSPRPPGERFGPVHFAFKSLEPTPEKFLLNAKNNGVKVYGPQKWKGRMKGESYYCYDPDDNLVEYWYPANGE